MRRRPRGFTLLEILVVVAVIAILSGALVLSAAGGGSERRVEDEAVRITRVLQLLCDQSVIEARFIGFGIGASAYAGYDFSDVGWKVIEGEGPLTLHPLPDGMQLSLPPGSTAAESLAPAVPEKPQFVCAPTGELGALDLRITVPGHAIGWRIDLDEAGQPRAALLTPGAR